VRQSFVSTVRAARLFEFEMPDVAFEVDPVDWIDPGEFVEIRFHDNTSTSAALKGKQRYVEVQGLRSTPAGVRGFESHPSHSGRGEHRKSLMGLRQ
jgi:hypothetical protein